MDILSFKKLLCSICGIQTTVEKLMIFFKKCEAVQ